MCVRCRLLPTSIQTWPAGSHVWGHYAEQTENGPAICRTENVSACDADGRGASSRACSPRLRRARSASRLTAFKDKMNYKQPGGAGFSPHQDVVAYPGVEPRAVDPASRSTSARSSRVACGWRMASIRSWRPTIVARCEPTSLPTLTFEPAELAGGRRGVHRRLRAALQRGQSQRSARRVLVASYAPVSEGYSRAQYYAARRATMADASARDGRFRISTLADFEGDEVTPDDGGRRRRAPTRRCYASDGSPSTRPSTP